MIRIFYTCRSCGAVLKGRRDKKFCDDHCRVRHHRLNRPQRLVQRVDETLLTNRTLLRKVRSMGEVADKAEATFEWLRRNGFDFNFHTHVACQDDGRTVVMCYEEGYVLENMGVRVLSEPAQNLNLLR